MIGYRPFPYMKYCWKFFTPCIATVSTTRFCGTATEYVHACKHKGVQRCLIHLVSPSLTANHKAYLCNGCVSSCSGHVVFCSGQIHPSEIQQHLPVPLVGPCIWAFSRFLFSPRSANLVPLQPGRHSWNNKTGAVKYLHPQHIWTARSAVLWF